MSLTPAAALRTTPPVVTWRVRPVLARNATVARAWFWVVVSGFFEPLFYLLTITVGLDDLVGVVTDGDRVVDYATFVAPGLLAASAMNGAVYENTANIFAKLKWQKVYDAMIATPISPRDIAVAELVWGQLRGAVYAAAFLLVAVAMGLVGSWWAVLALPAASLIGVAFAGVALAGTTYMRTWQDFEIVPLIQLPLFLFSATFYPLSTYPEALGWVVRATPLYHGVALERQLLVGDVSWTALVHVAYLVVMAAIGLSVAMRRFDVLLRT